MSEQRGSSFGGEPIWPKGTTPYRVEFSMSCGWVIVDPDGRESTLGYAKQTEADDVADKMNEAYWNGAYRHGASRMPPGTPHAPPAGTVRLPDGRDVQISAAGMHVLTSIADGNPLGAYITAGILDWHPPQEQR